MLNHVFIILICLGIIAGLAAAFGAATVPDTFDGRMDAMKTKGQEITDYIVDMAETSVKISIGYIGLMSLWLGIMKIADASGLVKSMVRVLKPIMTRLFPRVPVDHPAMGAMLMNIAANMLGLDNAATPLGLKAMKELQTLNVEKDTASNAMIMFMAINTSSVTMIPFGVMVWRSAFESKNPQIILGPATLATMCSTIVGITAAYTLGKIFGRTRDLYDEYIAGKDLSKINAELNAKYEKGSEA